MSIEIIILLLSLAATAAFIVYQSRQAKQLREALNEERTQVATLNAEKSALQSNCKEKSAQLLKYDTDCRQLREQIEELKLEHREQQTRLKTEQDKLHALENQFEQQKSQFKAELKNEFKVLSEETFRERQKALHEQNKEGIGALIKPLQEQISQFQRRVNDVHSETLKGHTSLEVEIKKIMEVGLKIGADASNLTSALKGDARQRGAWGEAQLERTLEMSGLIKDVHYKKQPAFKDRDGKQRILDYLILLPDRHHIVIDSKVSLIAYDRAVAAMDEGEQVVAMNEHIKAIKKHIDDLAAKNYTDLIGVHSPNYVLMFMPIESAYIEALKWSKDLFGYGYNKNIVLISHTTLIPILRVVSNLWMLEQSNQQVQEITDCAGSIYNSVCLVAERFQKLGNTLNTASKHYDSSIAALSGSRGLARKVENFKQLSAKANKEMPDLEPRNFEFSTHSLQHLENDKQ